MNLMLCSREFFRKGILELKQGIIGNALNIKLVIDYHEPVLIVSCLFQVNLHLGIRVVIPFRPGPFQPDPDFLIHQSISSLLL